TRRSVRRAVAAASRHDWAEQEQYAWAFAVALAVVEAPLGLRVPAEWGATPEFVAAAPQPAMTTLAANHGMTRKLSIIYPLRDRSRRVWRSCGLAADATRGLQEGYMRDRVSVDQPDVLVRGHDEPHRDAAGSICAGQ